MDANKQAQNATEFRTGICYSQLLCGVIGLAAVPILTASGKAGALEALISEAAMIASVVDGAVGLRQPERGSYISRLSYWLSEKVFPNKYSSI